MLRTLFILLALIFLVHLPISIRTLDETQWTPVYQYRNSFKTTTFNVRGSPVPYWQFGGDAVVTEDFVRLTGTEKSRKGYLWNTMAVTYPNWMVILTMKISPNPEAPQRLGADGMAFWYTQERMEEGPVFGNRDRWNGLAITFDTFDNDGKRDNPFVAALLNDGTRSYDKGQDGKNLILSGCQVNYRGILMKVKIIYFQNTLELYYDLSQKSLEEMVSWTKCFSIPNLQLPQAGYFGISAETGDLFDNHDVYSFSAYRLLDKKDQETEVDETKKLDQQQQQQQTQQNAQQQQQQNAQQQQQQQQPQQQQQQQQQKEVDNTLSQQQKPKNAFENIKTLLKQDLDESSVQKDSQSQPTDSNTNNVPRSQSNPDTTTGDKIQKESNQQTSDSNLLDQLTSLKQQVDHLFKQITFLKQSQLSLTQALIDFQNSLPSKSDFSTLFRGFEENEQKILNQVRHDLNQIDTRLNSLSQVDQNNANDIKQTLRTLLNTVERVKAVVEGSNNNAQNLMNSLERSKQEISQLVESRTSYSFWIFFLFFQVCFAIAFFWWKRLKEEASKKFI